MDIAVGFGAFDVVITRYNRTDDVIHLHICVGVCFRIENWHLLVDHFTRTNN